MINRGGYTAETSAAFRSGILIEPDANGSIPVPTAFVNRVGLGYTAEKRQNAMILPDGSVIAIEKRFNLVRSDDGHLLSPDPVSDRYSPCNPADMAEILDYFAREGFGTTDFAKTLYDGTSEIIALRLDFGGDIPVSGDNSQYLNYLVFQNFHDGNGLRYRVVRNRLRCMNQMTAGLCDGTIRHTGDIKNKLQFARDTWENARNTIKAQSERLGLLMNIPTVVETTVDKLLGIDRAKLDDVSTQKINLAERIVSASRNPINYGEKPESFGAIYQGITWINSNYAGGKGTKTADSRLESILGGTAGKLEAKAWNVLAGLAGIA